MSPSPAPVPPIRIVMVRPRSPGNVGSAARALKNFGLSRLVLAELPSFEDPTFFETESRKLAWKARDVLEGAETFPDLSQALEGVQFCLGTAPRGLRGTPTMPPEEAAQELVRRAREGQDVALVFGGEADGLRKHEMSLLSGNVWIPTSADYTDLNLAQSVVVCCHEIFRAAGRPEAPQPRVFAGDEALTVEEEEALFQAAAELLSEVGFFKTPGDTLALELRRILARSDLRQREAKVFRGMIRQLAWGVRQGLDS